MVKHKQTDAVEVTHGEWIKRNPNSIYCICSKCENFGLPVYKFCTNCGKRIGGNKRRK